VTRSRALRSPLGIGVAGAALAIALVGSIALSVTIGPADLTAGEVWGSIWSHLSGAESPLSPLRDGIVWELRLPRILTGAAVGAGLALVGAIMQALTRNQLADPYLLGISSGASLGAVTVLLLGAAVFLPLAAFAGALLALGATLALAGAFGRITPTRTVLAGVAVSSLAAAVTSFVIFWVATGDAYREVLAWLLGSLAGARWEAVLIAGGAIVVLGIPLALTGRILDAFTLGDTTASSLGVPVQGVRWGLLAASALLTGALVAVSGSIGFVGLVLPHAVRLLAGPGNRALLPLSALVGAVFLVWADTLARTVFEPRELPVGIVTAIVGAPVFAALLIRRRSEA
jgi:iron complex transport system permease protein